MKVRVHRCNFVQWMPSAVQAMAVDPTGSFLALGRSNGDIEVWSMNHAHTRAKYISGGIAPVRTLNALAWVSSDRLLSVGESGVAEWDLDRLTLKSKIIESEFNAIAVDPSGEMAVVGGVDGVIRVYDVSGGRVEYKRSFQRLGSGEITCLRWHPDGLRVVSGNSTGSIRVWDVSSGRSSVYISTLDGPEVATVWDLVVLKDGTIVSGSSSGKTQFWDGEMGTLLQAFTEHVSDVLCVAADPVSGAVFSTGVDTKVCQFVRNVEEATKGGLGLWRRQATRRCHTLDVLQLVVAGGYVYAGGLDAEVTQYPVAEFQRAEITRHSALPQRSVMCLQGDLLLSQQATGLNLWRLGASEEDDEALHRLKSKSALHVTSHPTLLLQLSPKGGNMAATALSPGGRWLAWSDRSRLKLFQLTYGEANRVTVKRMSLPGSRARQNGRARLQPSTTLRFSADNRRLFSATHEGTVQVVDLDPLQVAFTVRRAARDMRVAPSKVEEQMKEADESSEDEDDWGFGRVVGISRMAICPNGRWLALVFADAQVQVFDISLHGTHVCTLPYFGYVSALGFHATRPWLVAACADGTLVVWDVESNAPTPWSKRWNSDVPECYKRVRGPILEVLQVPLRPSVLLLRAEHCFVQIDFEKPARTARVVERYASMMLLDWVDAVTMAVVERPYARMMDQFDVQPLKRKAYRS